MIKQASDIIIPKLQLFNKCPEEEKHSCKMAQNICRLLFKKGNPTFLQNYKSISLFRFTANGEKLTKLRHALFTENSLDLKEMLTDLEKKSKSIGPKISINKTKNVINKHPYLVIVRKILLCGVGYFSSLTSPTFCHVKCFSR